jgi:hypothetical protein
VIEQSYQQSASNWNLLKIDHDGKHIHLFHGLTKSKIFVKISSRFAVINTLSTILAASPNLRKPLFFGIFERNENSG